MTIYKWITTFLVPETGIVSWLAGARMRKNESIKAMQTTIDMLVGQNADLYKQVLDLRRENAELKDSANKHDLELSELKHQIEKLSK